MLLDGRWSRKFDRCQKCGATEKPHMARGYCVTCYELISYQENKPRERATRKRMRLRASESKTKAVYEQQQRWKDANRERALAAQHEWYERNKGAINAWPSGLTVWVPFAGIWCVGLGGAF